MAQMQEFGIIDKPAKPAAPEPVKAKTEEAKPPVAKQEIKDENNQAPAQQEWQTQFTKAPVGSYEVQMGTSLKLEQTPEQKAISAENKLGSFLS